MKRFSAFGFFMVLAGCAAGVHQSGGGFTKRSINGRTVVVPPIHSLLVADPELFEQNWVAGYGIPLDSVNTFFSALFGISLRHHVERRVAVHVIPIIDSGQAWRTHEFILVEGVKDTIVRRGTWSNTRNDWDSIWVQTTTRNHVARTYARITDSLVFPEGQDLDISISVTDLRFGPVVYKDGPLSTRAYSHTEKKGFDFASLSFVCAWVELPVSARYLIWDHRQGKVLRYGIVQGKGASSSGCEVNRDHWLTAVDVLATQIVTGTPLHREVVAQQPDLDASLGGSAKAAPANAHFGPYLQGLLQRNLQN